MNMNIITVIAISALALVLGTGLAMEGSINGFENSMKGGSGMRGNAESGMMGDPAMMGTQGSALDARAIMMGYTDNANANPLTIEKANEAVEQYLAATGNTDLELTEVVEFDNNFYAAVREKSTGVHAFELLVNMYTGTIVAEMGPNIMWNTRYSPMAAMMGSQVHNVTEKQALEYAQQYLDKALTGAKAVYTDAFYGYYTVHVLKDGKLSGMISVHSSTGAVWNHSWLRL